jgi:Ca-activated chloride channel family protein
LAGLSGAASAAGLLKPIDRPNALAIQDHDVTVLIEDGYATTTIEQVFHNDGATDFEAVYAFPVPERAAVSEFTYWIDGKPITAEVMAKAQARETYENEKAAGRETALAEQDDYKRFHMSVWPVRAHANVKIRLTYIQPVKLDGGVGRYAYPLEEGGVDDPAAASFWSMSDEVAGRFQFEMAVRTAYPVEALRLPNNPDALITQEADGWRVSIVEHGIGPEGDAGATNARSLNQDVIAYWRQPANLPGSLDVITHRPDPNGRGTFMAVLTPGDDLPPVTSGRDWTFIIDRSGSMDTKFATLVEGIDRALKKLPPQDRFRIVAFDDSAQRLFRGFKNADAQNATEATRALANLGIGGGTNLYAGLELGLAGGDDDRPHGVMLITDGVANVGLTTRKDFVELAAANDVRLFTFIMGNSANRPLLQHLADVSGGDALAISNSDDITGRIMTASMNLSHHALTDIELDIKGVQTADLTPGLPAALHRGKQFVVFGHYWGDGAATVNVKGRVAGKSVQYQMSMPLQATASRHPELERLWAFAAIEDQMRKRALLGADEDTQQAIVDTAVEYGLLTPFTSMIVVRQEIFAQLGVDRINKARLEKEWTAREQRLQQDPTAASSIMSGQPRAHVSNGGGAGGSGAAGPLLLALLAFLRRVLRRNRKPVFAK